MATSQSRGAEIRLLVVNPNTSDVVTGRIHREALAAAGEGTRVETVSAPSGIPLIETAEGSRRAGGAVVRVLQDRAGAFDAAIIAAYSDPGLPEARACVPEPVVGIGEASVLEALALGGRFVVLMPGGPLADRVRQLVSDAGGASRLAGVRQLDAPLATVAADPTASLATIRMALRRAIDEDRADAIVLGGGPLAGIAARLAPEFEVPLLDGVVCAVQRAERLVRALRMSGSPADAPALTGMPAHGCGGRERTGGTHETGEKGREQ